MTCSVSEITIDSKEDFENISFTSKVDGFIILELSSSNVLSLYYEHVSVSANVIVSLNATDYFGPGANGTTTLTASLYDSSSTSIDSVEITLIVNAIATVSVGGHYYYERDNIGEYINAPVQDSTYTVWKGDEIIYYDYSPDEEGDSDYSIQIPSAGVELYPVGNTETYEVLGFSFYYVDSSGTHYMSGEQQTITIIGDTDIYYNENYGEPF